MRWPSADTWFGLLRMWGYVMCSMGIAGMIRGGSEVLCRDDGLFAIGGVCIFTIAHHLEFVHWRYEQKYGDRTP